MRGFLSAALGGAAYLLARASGALERPARAASGPLPAEARTPEPQAGPSIPMSGAPTGPAVPGTRQSAQAWAEAISQAGKQLSDEGFEDQAVMLFVAAGELAARACGDVVDG